MEEWFLAVCITLFGGIVMFVIFSVCVALDDQFCSRQQQQQAEGLPVAIAHEL